MVAHMIPMPEFNSVAEVLSQMASGGPQWSSRIVTLNCNREPRAWVTLYPITANSSPYFDFAYFNEASPQEALARVLASCKECEVIDWSPGRLACIQASGADLARLVEIITEVAKEAFGVNQLTVEAFYEDMQ
jgi:hypothetical protein